MFEHEDPYGLKKRLDFASALLASRSPALVLEIGCGTGALLLEPLAKRFPAWQFLGIDSDRLSIEFAVSRFASSNLVFAADASMAAPAAYDVVIASEVLEHVERPLEFLEYARSRLSPGGCVLLTIPNGYGAFELASTLQIVLDRFGLLEQLVTLKRRLFGAVSPAPVAALAPMTLAASPHVNFFSSREIRRLFAAAGFTVLGASNRTWLCGFLLDLLISRLGLAEWNARVADRLPIWMVADWMFVLVPEDSISGGSDYQPGLWARFRRCLNPRLED